jgi:hypothetical protein
MSRAPVESAVGCTDCRNGVTGAGPIRGVPAADPAKRQETGGVAPVVSAPVAE